MAERPRNTTSRVPVLKNIMSPLAEIQYNSFTEMLCNQKLQEGHNNSYLFPHTLEHFQQVNHLSNTTKRLEAEIDAMVKNGQIQPVLLRQKLTFLFSLQQEKLNHARAALQELRWQRNALGMRLLQENQVEEPMVASWIFQAGEEEAELPFTRQELLLNVKFAAASGVPGNSARAPLDDDLLEQMAGLFQEVSQGQNESLLVKNVDYQPYQRVNAEIEALLHGDVPAEEGGQNGYSTPNDNLTPLYRMNESNETPSPNLTPFGEQLLPEINSGGAGEIQYQQIDTVLAAFSEVNDELGDELSKFVPFKPRNAQNFDYKQLTQDLVHELEISAKRAQELLEKLGDKGRMTYLGEFLQYATFPCFSQQYEDSSDASMLSSVSTQPPEFEQKEEIFGNLDDNENRSEEFPHNEKYCFCDNSRQDDLIQCESGENCKFARDGWFHPRCLGIKAELVGDKFYCPGCCVLNGNDFKNYGDDWQMGKRKIQEIKRNMIDIWKRLFGIDLSKK